MFSIIVCSIRPNLAEILKKNIAATIGVPVEFIIHDNRNIGKGICQVYNECAERASYENLCFIHEDVEFVTENWGEIIAKKLAEDNCGVVGFAGSTVKTKALNGWGAPLHSDNRTNYIYRYKNKEKFSENNPGKVDYSEVVSIDGLCLFCTKTRWSEIRFDDKTLKGFHCYDIDFTLALKVAGYRNYVCHKVIVKHFSNGSYDINWWKENKKMHEKWESKLPLYISPTSELRKKYNEYMTNVDLTWKLGNKGIFLKKSKRYILGYFLTHPFNGRSYKLINKYIKQHKTRHK